MERGDFSVAKLKWRFSPLGTTSRSTHCFPIIAEYDSRAVKQSKTKHVQFSGDDTANN
jgi:hypothetical protein